MYGDEALIKIEIDSARAAATRSGRPFEDIIAQLFEIELHRIEYLTSRLREFGEPARDLIEWHLRWRQELQSDPIRVFAFRHEQTSRRVRLQLDDMQAALAKCTDALALVDSSLLDKCASIPSHTLRDIADCVCAPLRDLEVLALFGGGYNAALETVSGHNLLVFHSGLDDLLFSAVHLIAGFGTQLATHKRQVSYRTRSLRREPQRFATALAKARELVDLARGKRHMVDLELDQLDPAQEQVAQRLLKGALNFACFHEFGHAILARLPEPGHDELLCDEFAARLVLASNDHLQTCGMYIALDFLGIVSMLDGIAGRSATHPPVANRAKHFQLLIEDNKAQLDSAHDALLDISTRLKEELVFVMDSMDVLRRHLIAALDLTEHLALSSDARRAVAEAVANAALSMPKVEEDAIVTMQFDRGQRYRVVRFDIAAAIVAAASAVASVAGATSPLIVGTSALACLASLKSVARPLSDAEGAVLYALHQKHPSPQDRVALDATLALILPGARAPFDTAAAIQALLTIGCVRQEGPMYRLAERVLVRMPWPPSILPSSNPPVPGQ